MIEELQAVLQEAVEKQQIAGGAIRVCREGRPTLCLQAGYANREEKKEFTQDTIVRLYSATKPITAAAALLLVERGQLDLGAAVSDYLPSFESSMVAISGGLAWANRPIMVKDLLNMTSGLPYGGVPNSASSTAVQHIFDELEGATPAPLTTRQVADRLAACPLSFQPGESWMYGTGADVMGAVIEAASGMRFGEFLQKEFFDPLQMTDTGFYVPQARQPRLAAVYERADDKLRPYHGNRLGICNTMDRVPSFESGGAGLASTMPDYMKFAQMLLHGGRSGDKVILQPQTVKLLTEGKLTPWQQETMTRNWPGLSGHSYGNFMRVLEDPRQAVGFGSKGEYGWDGWLGFYFANSPKDKMTVMMEYQLTNAGTTPLTRRVRNLIWKELPCEK